MPVSSVASNPGRREDAMERPGDRNTGCAMPASRTARGLRARLLLLVGALAAGGCYVVPATDRLRRARAGVRGAGHGLREARAGLPMVGMARTRVARARLARTRPRAPLAIAAGPAMTRTIRPPAAPAGSGVGLERTGRVTPRRRGPVPADEPDAWACRGRAHEEGARAARPRPAPERLRPHRGPRRRARTPS